MLNKTDIICKYADISLSSFNKLKEANVINNKSINRAIVGMLIEDYRDKYITMKEACIMLARDLGITPHTVEAFVYNNRNKNKYVCSECGGEITSYRFYKNKKCLKCEL